MDSHLHVVSGVSTCFCKEAKLNPTEHINGMHLGKSLPLLFILSQADLHPMKLLLPHDTPSYTLDNIIIHVQLQRHMYAEFTILCLTMYHCYAHVLLFDLCSLVARVYITVVRITQRVANRHKT